ncbi:MAG: tail fiber protein [Bacteroidetes bacterium]|nr:tail fiber protein [Bacteroidota bacterium]
MAEVKMFGGNYPPKNWVYCQGQALSIQTNQALFSIMGTTFGGDGQTTFQLPDLRGRVAIGTGTGPGLTARVAGQMGGYERINLTINNIPPHNHTVNCDMTSTGRDASSEPEGKLPGKITGTNVTSYGSNLTGGHLMHANMVNPTGGNDPVTLMQPWTCINYIICITGTYPPRS